VWSASGDDGRKLFQCGAQRARIQGPKCNEPVGPIYLYLAELWEGEAVYVVSNGGKAAGKGMRVLPSTNTCK
jgi:hypothetical protein